MKVKGHFRGGQPPLITAAVKNKMAEEDGGGAFRVQESAVRACGIFVVI